MTTLVVQSHADSPPSWISRCTATVKAWADLNRFDYRQMGDEFLALAPLDIRAHCQEQPVVVTDVARLVWLRQCLEQYETAVWLDADFLIFSPEALNLPGLPYGVGREVWMETDNQGVLRSHKKVHNAFLMFRQENVFLEFYLETALRLIRANRGSFSPQFAGPKLLTALHNVVQLPVIESAGMMSPELADSILTGRDDVLELFLMRSPEKPAGVNLCSSLPWSDETMNSLVTTLLNRGI